MAKIHLISGKGGVGKTTVAAALAKSFDLDGQGPVLLIDIESDSEVAKLFKLEQNSYAPQKVLLSNDLWVTTLSGEECFKEYFTKLFHHKNEEANVVQELFQSISSRLIDSIMENKVIRAFINVCPGLKPIVILGKICWEAEKGFRPESRIPWSQIVIDAPSSGYVKMLFKSMMALKKAFTLGKINRQATESLELVQNPQRLALYIVTLLEELPLKESQELRRDMNELNIRTQKLVINKSPLLEEFSMPAPTAQVDEKTRDFLQTELEILSEKKNLLNQTINNIASEKITHWILSEKYFSESDLQIDDMCTEISTQRKEAP